ncbi:MAG: hypothetical protein QOE29_1300 [Gaiellaceae bacterium]|jgi:hypothetical protein|nr:hypothetical protein [Gaiellaceae bacterium]MDX6514772.1 hypothetical protein [Gaiellaceae bacterium]
MSAQKTLFKRLREAFSPPVVAPQDEYVRHTTEERDQLMARLFGVDRAEEAEPSGDAPATRRS